MKYEANGLIGVALTNRCRPACNPRPPPLALSPGSTGNRSYMASCPWGPRFRGQAAFVQTLPHSTKCGGLTEALCIGWMAQDHNVLYVPHGWNTAVGLHLTAALPVARWVEYLTPSPYLDELILTPFRPDADGLLTVPETWPGHRAEPGRPAMLRLLI